MDKEEIEGLLTSINTEKERILKGFKSSVNQQRGWGGVGGLGCWGVVGGWGWVVCGGVWGGWCGGVFWLFWFLVLGGFVLGGLLVVVGGVVGVG